MNTIAQYVGIRPTFLGVPQEIRNLIYDLLINQKIFKVIASSSGDILSGIVGDLVILRVNRQVYDEALRVLRVKVVSIHKSAFIHDQQCSRILDHLRRYYQTIEHVYTEYDLKQINDMARYRTGDDLNPIACLDVVFRELPRLRGVTISCGNADWNTVQSPHIEDLLWKLTDLLPDYDRIMTTARNISKGQDSAWSIQIKFVRTSVLPSDEEEKIFDISRSSVRKVLLDVMDHRQSHQIRVLTLGPVNIDKKLS